MAQWVGTEPVMTHSVTYSVDSNTYTEMTTWCTVNLGTSGESWTSHTERITEMITVMDHHAAGLHLRATARFTIYDPMHREQLITAWPAWVVRID